MDDAHIHGIKPFKSDDPDSERIFWEDGGVHQNLTFPVQPDFISGQHCWHQKVRVTKPGPDDKYGDVFVDTNKSHEVYKRGSAKPARRRARITYAARFGCRGRISPHRKLIT